jgi:Lectin C-type domain
LEIVSDVVNRLSPIRLIVPALLCAACGRLGYEEIVTTTGSSGSGGVGGSSGGAGAMGGAGTAGSGGASATGGSDGNGGNGGTSGAAGSGGTSSVDGGLESGAPGCSAATFNGHDYLLCKTSLNQPDAAAVCAANGMRLAKVEDATENQWIVDTLAGPVLPVDSGVNWIWLGGSDAVTEGSWLWPDGTLFYQNGPVGGLFTNWGPAEPNDARSGEDCLALRINYRWTDLACTEVHLFCCEAYP